MTGTKLRDALELLRGLKKQYPNESDDELERRFRSELERGAMRRAIVEDVFKEWLQQLTGERTH
jgi:hypothetical protein